VVPRPATLLGSSDFMSFQVPFQASQIGNWFCLSQQDFAFLNLVFGKLAVGDVQAASHNTEGLSGFGKNRGKPGVGMRGSVSILGHTTKFVFDGLVEEMACARKLFARSRSSG